MKTYCRRCGHEVIREQDEELAKTYPWYCPNCDENMFQYEVEDPYEIRRDTFDDGTPVFDVYRHTKGDSECLESFYSHEDAVKYVEQLRKENN